MKQTDNITPSDVAFLDPKLYLRAKNVAPKRELGALLTRGKIELLVPWPKT